MTYVEANKLRKGDLVRAPLVGVRSLTRVKRVVISDDPRVKLRVVLEGHPMPINYRLLEVP